MPIPTFSLRYFPLPKERPKDYFNSSDDGFSSEEDLFPKKQQAFAYKPEPPVREKPPKAPKKPKPPKPPKPEKEKKERKPRKNSKAAIDNQPDGNQVFFSFRTVTANLSLLVQGHRNRIFRVGR